MRPKKVILCVDPDENALSVLSFTLVTNGYRVRTAISAQQAISIFSQVPVDLVLSIFTLPRPMDGIQLIAALKKRAPGVPMLLRANPSMIGDRLHLADATLPLDKCPTLELLDRIRFMTARKRGPNKGTFQRMPAASAPAPPVLEEAAVS